MKAQFLRRAKHSIRPYDQVRFSNKIGKGAQPDHGLWVPSTGRVKRRIRNRDGYNGEIGPFSRGKSRSPSMSNEDGEEYYEQDNGMIDMN